MRNWVPMGVLLVLLTGCPQTSFDISQAKIIDLTYPFDSDTVYWPTEEDFTLQETFKGMTEGGYFYASNKFRAPEHGGTHLDAPIHFSKGKRSVDQIPIEQLIGPGFVVDVSQKSLKNPDSQIFVEDLLEWEKTHGQIPHGAILLLKTGYGKFWPDRKKYMGTNERGKQALSQLHFPGLHPGAARWLIQNRDIKAVGIDTPSIDFGQTKNFLTHQILFGANIPAIENVANLDKLPYQGFNLIALPMKIAGGSGAPTRIIAILPKTP